MRRRRPRASSGAPRARSATSSASSRRRGFQIEEGTDARLRRSAPSSWPRPRRRRDTRDKADREAKTQLKDAEARGARLLEQSRHQATDLTNTARAEIDQSLEWARVQGTDIIRRAREGAEQLLGAAGLGGTALDQVVKSIVEASGRSRRGSADRRRAAHRLGPRRRSRRRSLRRPSRPTRTPNSPG